MQLTDPRPFRSTISPPYSMLRSGSTFPAVSPGVTAAATTIYTAWIAPDMQRLENDLRMRGRRCGLYGSAVNHACACRCFAFRAVGSIGWLVDVHGQRADDFIMKSRDSSCSGCGATDRHRQAVLHTFCLFVTCMPSFRFKETPAF